MTPIRPASGTECHRGATDRSEPSQVDAAPRDVDALLADVVTRIREAITTQASNAHWRTRGVALPEGFADDAARNAAGALVELIERFDAGED